MSPLTARTPAKLNLGLEIASRRADGYHEIWTIFQSITIYDELSFEPSPVFAYDSDPSIDAATDLARPIFEAAALRHGWRGQLRASKSIPVAAGLGGGSSDAALALRLDASAARRGVDHVAAARIGADVPFFVHGGTALATGIGEQLEPLETPDIWFVVHVPPISITDKTRTLFQGLVPADFSIGGTVRRIAQGLSGYSALPETLPNAFHRQMAAFPDYARAWNALDALAGRVALSGAGPALYSWHESHADARRICAALESSLSGATYLCRSSPRHQDEQEIQRLARALASRDRSG